MDFVEIEGKWQKKWKETSLYKFDETKLDKKYYLLEMFSYPSGAKLHLGHWWNFGLSDSFGRYKRMQGYNVFQPMGFDAFGLPAESYALKTGIHPEDSTRANIAAMENQLRRMGATFNWEYELITCNPDYYKWTQWIFVQLMKRGLAYQKYSPVNWCPSCKTVLANEQVIDGKCERCENEVIKKNMTQWFLKITDYAEELLAGLDKIDWPEKTKTLQRNWIGKSIGAEIDFATEEGDKLTVFTTRADTLFGVTYLVIAPEHPLVDKLTTLQQSEAVKKYCQNAAKMDEITRTSCASEKTGVFTGSYCINPVNGKKVPIYVGDYVVASYATGIVMGVAAHDERDFEYAKKQKLEIVRVIVDKKGRESELPFCQYGRLVNSDEFNGLTSEDAIKKIVEKLEKQGKARKKVNYKLRDWSVSRQRYWGCPIPVIYCKEHGAVPVPEKDLPVILPHISDYKPDGHGPLGKVDSYMNTVCPICNKPARRDPDTLDTFMCSTWYQLRYPNVHNDKEIVNREKTNKILPVDKYVGGIEHATSHLLYSRFITKFLRDVGCFDFDEPFISLVHQGMVLGEDGKKMSKRNTAKSADDYINEFGSDALRMHMMFSLKYVDGGIWKDEGIKHIKAFMERIERIVKKWAGLDSDFNGYGKEEQELDYVYNFSIKEICNSFEEFSFNTAIARLMELVNAMYKYDLNSDKNAELCKDIAKNLIILIAPCTPHFAEQLWEDIGQDYSVHNQHYPKFDQTKLTRSTCEIAIQVNSKIITRMEIDGNLSDKEIIEQAKTLDKISPLLEGKQIVKEIVVPKRLVNIILN